MNVLEKSNIVNVAEDYLNNFKKHLLEHVRHNEYEALNAIYTEIDVLQNAINNKQIVSSDYFLDILSEMRQLTYDLLNNSNKNNNVLSESVRFELNSNTNVIGINKLKRMIKHTLINNDQLRDMSYKLHDAMNNYNSSQYLNECEELFGKYDIERYRQLYEVIIKNNNIYDSVYKNNMSKQQKKSTVNGDTTISIAEIKNLIDQVIQEQLSNEVNYLVSDPDDPQDSVDDFAADNLEDLRDTVNTLIANVKNETGNWDKSYDRLVDIYKKLTNAIDNPRLSNSQRKQLEHDYDGILGNIHSVIGGGGRGTEKFYVAESDSKCSCGKVAEQCNCKKLSECGSWNEAIKHPDFKNAIMTEVAPPGMENWVKANKKRFKDQYGDKKGIGALYATAWKMFYKNKNK